MGALLGKGTVSGNGLGRVQEIQRQEDELQTTGGGAPPNKPEQLKIKDPDNGGGSSTSDDSTSSGSSTSGGSDSDSSNDSGSSGNTIPKTPDPVMPAECPGGCPVGYECKDGRCVKISTGEDYQITITEEDGKQQTGDGNGEKAVGKPETPQPAIISQLKQVDKKVWYGLGGGLGLIVLISIAN